MAGHQTPSSPRTYFLLALLVALVVGLVGSQVDSRYVAPAYMATMVPLVLVAISIQSRRPQPGWVYASAPLAVGFATAAILFGRFFLGSPMWWALSALISALPLVVVASSGTPGQIRDS